jgi:PEP-CTERM motif
MNRYPTSAAPGHARLARRLSLHAAWATAATSLLALPAQACDDANRVYRIAIDFTSRIAAGVVVDNAKTLGCVDSIPLVIETGGVLNNFAGLTNEPGSSGGPNGIGGLFVQNGLLDNKLGATLTNLGDFYVSYRGSPAQGTFINSGSFINKGLFINWGNVTSTGLIDNQSARFESHSYNFVIAGGSFDNSGTASFQYAFTNQATVNNTGTFIADDFGFEFHNQGSFNNASGATLRLNGGLGVLDMSGGTLDNRGKLLVNGGMSVGDAALYGSLHLLAGGEFAGGLTVATQFHEQVNAGTLHNTGGMFLYGTLRNEGVLQSTSSILVGSSQGASLVNNNDFSLTGATVTNYSLVTNNAAMSVGSGGIVVNGGTVNGNTGGHLQNNGVLSILAGGRLDNVVTMENTGTLGNAGSMTSTGSLRNTDTATFNNTNVFVGDGEVINQGVINNSGSFKVTGILALDGSFNNTGTVEFATDSHTGGIGSYTQTAGRTYLNGSIDALDGFEILGGDFCGKGSTANVARFVNNGGTICPGTSPGTLRIGGTLDFVSGTLLMEIAGTAPSQFDVLRVGGLASFSSGVLRLSFLNGYLPTVGDHWGLFEFTGGVAGLSNLTLQTDGLPAGSALRFSLSPTGELAVTAVPEPTSMALFLAGLAAISLRSVRRASIRARETG